MQEIKINGFTITIEARTGTTTGETYHIASTRVPLRDGGAAQFFNAVGKTSYRAVQALECMLSAVSLTARRLNPADDGAASRIHELCLELIYLDVANMDTPEPSPANQDKTALTIG